MNTENFREDIRKMIGDGTMSQAEIVRRSGVSQSTLSMFLSGESKELMSKHLFRLWPVIYGKPLIPHGEV